jgi:hypothetical protein
MGIVSGTAKIGPHNCPVAYSAIIPPNMGKVTMPLKKSARHPANRAAAP